MHKISTRRTTVAIKDNKSYNNGIFPLKSKSHWKQELMQNAKLYKELEVTQHLIYILEILDVPNL